MKKLLAVLGVVSLSGCIAGKSEATRRNDPEKLIAVDDAEARGLGYPKTFISKEKKQMDWSSARTEKIGGMPVRVIDGATVELCGGLCDK